MQNITQATTSQGWIVSYADSILPPIFSMLAITSTVLIFVGLVGAAIAIGAILWSIVHPATRIWPPVQYSRETTLIVWGTTLLLIVSIFGLGVIGWGQWEIPYTVRFGVGTTLTVVGNVGVWYEVTRFGFKQTSGAIGTLKTTGLYRYSRNPQYVSDIVLLLGWALLFASLVAWPVILATIIVLLIAPLSEEIWMEEHYGEAYLKYKSQVRRYI